MRRILETLLIIIDKMLLKRLAGSTKVDNVIRSGYRAFHAFAVIATVFLYFPNVFPFFLTLAKDARRIMEVLGAFTWWRQLFPSVFFFIFS